MSRLRDQKMKGKQKACNFEHTATIIGWDHFKYSFAQVHNTIVKPGANGIAVSICSRGVTQPMFLPWFNKDMNVVLIDSPDTLLVINECGLVGIYLCKSCNVP